MSSQGRREESLIRDLDEMYGSSAAPIAVRWLCSACGLWHFTRPGMPRACVVYPSVVRDGRHLLSC